MQSGEPGLPKKFFDNGMGKWPPKKQNVSWQRCAGPDGTTSVKVGHIVFSRVPIGQIIYLPFTMKRRSAVRHLECAGYGWGTYFW
ncbi:MAG: hypothetical protein KatS3mg110_0446 [Pirellulaceae bacterium]|nr:MAG: hypothetical protein KatS3mg110_0446 [Pirellulaceae bacterium]